MHCCDRIEGFGGEDDLAAMAECCEKTEREAEAVEEGWWAAECVVGGKVHTVTYEARVVHEVAVLVVSIGVAFEVRSELTGVSTWQLWDCQCCHW